MGRFKHLLKFMIRRLDFFGVPITFTGSHRLKYQTKLGGIISILFSMYMIYMCYRQLERVIQRIEMQIQNQILFNENPKELNINSQTFAFAFKIENYQLTNKSYFYANMQLIKMNYDNNTNARSYNEIANITYEQCTLDHFKQLDYYNEQMEQELLQLSIQNYYCPQFSNYPIFGRYTSQQFQYIKLEFLICNNQIHEECASLQSIYNFVEEHQGITIDFLMANVNINSQSIHTQTGFFDSNMYFQLYPQNQKIEVNYYLRDFVMATDEALFFGSEKIYDNYLIHQFSDNEQHTTILNNQNNPNAFFKMYIRSSQYSQQIDRTFYRISDFLAYLGGLAKGIYMLVGFFIFIYNRYQLWLKLFKINYQIILQSHQNMSRARFKLSRKGQHINLPRVFKNTDQKKHLENTKILLQGLAREKYNPQNTIIPQLKYIFTGVCWWVKSWFIRRISLQQAINLIQKDLNIVSYFRLIQDVQKLKYLLLNQQQLRIFNIHQKQTLIIKVEDILKSHSRQQKQDKNSKYKKQRKQPNILYQSQLNRKRNSTQIQIFGTERPGYEDCSHQLDAHNQELYGTDYQNQLVVDYLVLLENLHQLETMNSRSKQQITSAQMLASIKSQRSIVKENHVNTFEQIISYKLVSTLGEDIQEIIQSDDKLSKLYLNEQQPGQQSGQTTRLAQDSLLRSQNVSFSTAIAKLSQNRDIAMSVKSVTSETFSPKKLQFQDVVEEDDEEQTAPRNLLTIKETIQQHELDINEDSFEETELQELANFDSENIIFQNQNDCKIGFSRDLSRSINTKKQEQSSFYQKDDKAEILLKSILIEKFEIQSPENRFKINVSITRIGSQKTQWTIKFNLLQQDYEYFIFIQKKNISLVNGIEMSSKKILNSFDIGEDYVIKKNNRKEEVVIEVVVDQNRNLDYNNLTFNQIKEQSTQVIVKSQDNYFYDFYLSNLLLKDFKLENCDQDKIKGNKSFQNHLYLTIENVCNDTQIHNFFEELQKHINEINSGLYFSELNQSNQNICINYPSVFQFSIQPLLNRKGISIQNKDEPASGYLF